MLFDTFSDNVLDLSVTRCLRSLRLLQRGLRRAAGFARPTQRVLVK